MFSGLLRNVLFIIIGCCIALHVFAEKTKQQLLTGDSPESIGEAIAIELDDRDLGFINQTSKMEMILRNAHGQENTRVMETRILERPERTVGDKSLLIFYNPRDINGTALLSFAEILEPDQQWLYLPALKRVKRISSKNKSGPFVGSEFAYEDITSNEIGKYSWRYEGLEPCPLEVTLECFKLVTIPKYEHSGYTKRVVWVDVEEFRAYKVDFYDRKNSLLKTQTFHGYKQYLDKFWRADSWKMHNHQSGKSTELHFKQYQFKTNLTDNDFSKASLKRVR
ncbi:MAG: outer membrane lipoprotein-sorting protein [Gammaproteobacteria bacterium]|nr:outer membrane lipoprotein-sorting protein [Gammaproteobacteria bacterium]